MARISFVDSSGAEHRVDARLGQSVMEAAVKNGIPGIIADCGGSCTCATCRVFVSAEWRTKTGEPQQIERDMLEFADDGRPGVRLSCQISLTDELDGLVVHIPDPDAQ